MKPFYYVFNPERDKPTYRHKSVESAIEEAERLAQLNPGEDFVVLEAVGVARVERPQIFQRFEYDIPF